MHTSLHSGKNQTASRGCSILIIYPNSKMPLQVLFLGGDPHPKVSSNPITPLYTKKSLGSLNALSKNSSPFYNPSRVSFLEFLPFHPQSSEARQRGRNNGTIPDWSKGRINSGHDVADDELPVFLLGDKVDQPRSARVENHLGSDDIRAEEMEDFLGQLLAKDVLSDWDHDHWT